jgi:hypothetical protein
MQTKVIVNILKGQSPEMDWPLLTKRDRSIVGYSDCDVHGYTVGYSRIVDIMRPEDSAARRAR